MIMNTNIKERAFKMKKLLTLFAISALAAATYADEPEDCENELKDIEDTIAFYEGVEKIISSDYFVAFTNSFNVFTTFTEDVTVVKTNYVKHTGKREKDVKPEIESIVTNVIPSQVNGRVRPISEAKYKHYLDPLHPIHIEGLGVCTTCLHLKYALKYKTPEGETWLHPDIGSYLLVREPLPEGAIEKSFLSDEEKQGMTCPALTNNIGTVYTFNPKTEKLVPKTVTITNPNTLHARTFGNDFIPLLYIAEVGQTYRVYPSWKAMDPEIDRSKPFKLVRLTEWRECGYKFGELVQEYKIAEVICPICGPTYKRCRIPCTVSK